MASALADHVLTARGTEDSGLHVGEGGVGGEAKEAERGRLFAEKINTSIINAKGGGSDSGILVNRLVAENIPTATTRAGASATLNQRSTEAERVVPEESDPTNRVKSPPGKFLVISYLSTLFLRASLYMLRLFVFLLARASRIRVWECMRSKACAQRLNSLFGFIRSDPQPPQQETPTLSSPGLSQGSSQFLSRASAVGTPPPVSLTNQLTLTHGFILVWTLWTTLLALLGWLEATLLGLLWASFLVVLGIIWLSQIKIEAREQSIAKFWKFYAEIERQTMLSYIVVSLFAVRVMWALGLLVSLEVIIFASAVAYIIASNTRSDEEKRLTALNILASSGIRNGSGGPASSVDVIADAELLRRVLGSDLPPWVSFPNISRGDFFNVLIRGMWPYMSEALDNSTRPWLDSLLEVYRPSGFSKLAMSVVKFGTVPIVVNGVEAATVGNNSYLDLHVSWASDSDLQMAARLSMPPADFTIQLRHVKLRGIMRIEFGSHVKQWPCFSTYSFSFIGPPELSFDLSFAGLNAGMIPYAKAYFYDLFKYFINIWLVHPNRLRYAAIANAEETSTRADAHGLLYLRLRTIEGHKNRLKVLLNFIGDSAILQSNAVTPKQEGGGSAASVGNTATVRSTDAKTKGYVADIDDYFQMIIYDKSAMLRFALHDASSGGSGSASAAPIATATEYIRTFSDREGQYVGRAVPLKRRVGDGGSGGVLGPAGGIGGGGLGGGDGGNFTSDLKEFFTGGVFGERSVGGSSSPAGAGGGSVGAATGSSGNNNNSSAKAKTDLMLRYDAQYYPFLSVEESKRFWDAIQSSRRVQYNSLTKLRVVTPTNATTVDNNSSMAAAVAPQRNISSFSAGAGGGGAGATPSSGGINLGISPDIPLPPPTPPASQSSNIHFDTTPPLLSVAKGANTASSAPPTAAVPSAGATSIPAGAMYFSRAVGSVMSSSPASGPTPLDGGLPSSSSHNNRSSGPATGLHGVGVKKTRNVRKPSPLAVLFVNINRCQDLLTSMEGVLIKSRRDPDVFIRVSFLSQVAGCDHHVDTQMVKANRHPSFWFPCSFTIYNWEDRVGFEVFDDDDRKPIGRILPIALDEVAENGFFMKVTKPLVEAREVDAGTITFELTLRVIGNTNN